MVVVADVLVAVGGETLSSLPVRLLVLPQPFRLL